MLDCLMALATIKCHWTSQGQRDSTLVQGCRPNPSWEPTRTVEPGTSTVLKKSLHGISACVIGSTGIREARLLLCVPCRQKQLWRPYRCCQLSRLHVCMISHKQKLLEGDMIFWSQECLWFAAFSLSPPTPQAANPKLLHSEHWAEV